MRSVLFFTLVFSVASVFGQQPFVRHPDNLRKAVPHHFNHDQKNAYRSVDKIARGHKVGPRQAPLRPQQTVPWLQWVQEGRWAAQADRNSEMLKVRAKLLEEKLKPNQFIFKPQINPQLKPKLNKKENGRIKREIEESRRKSNKEIKVNENPRHKRDVIMSQHIPKVVMPSEDQFEGRIKETEKRHKRQIVYFINRPPQLLARSPRTTPNPFIRDTHIDDYDIIRPEVGEREGMIPTVESGSSDPGSYPLVKEESNEFATIISQFYLTTSEEHWTAIQHFAHNILRPLSQLTEKKEELLKVLKEVKEMGERANKNVLSVLQKYQTSPSNEDERTNHNRVKRRVNKTLQRKRAKKKKQRLRRFERKRLRMLTHARRVRRQQKSKQARLQRHYERMNMSTTATPDHLKNKTMVGEDHDEKQSARSESKDDEETDEEDVEYESSEYEDEDETETDSKDKSKGTRSKTSETDSEESDESSGESGTGSKPDYGNDDYEDYDEESDDEYEDESSEESVKRKKEKVKGKKVKVAKKNMEKLSLRMIRAQPQGGKPKRKSINVSNIKKYQYLSENPRDITQIKTKESPYIFQRNNILHKQPLQVQVHRGLIKSNGQNFNSNIHNIKNIGEENNKNIRPENDLNRDDWIPALNYKKITSGGKAQIGKI